LAETVRLETITDSEVEARELAEEHLEAIGRPLSAFVPLRPSYAAWSVDFPQLVAKYGATVTAAADEHQPSVH
jgi:hypothetical protein